jgi:predicted anti-sigma-YlaC factor YlaD
MTCEGWQELILEPERLAPAEQNRLQQHLACCSGCRLWANALAEVDSILTAELRAAIDPSALHQRIARAVAHERRWMTRVPEALDALGWSALAILVMASLLLCSNCRPWHLWLAGAATLSGSLAWAARALGNERP